jgi:hypothetical protein
MPDARNRTSCASGSVVIRSWRPAPLQGPGILLGPIFGRVSGTFMAFLIPFLGLGIAQGSDAAR